MRKFVLSLLAITFIALMAGCAGGPAPLQPGQTRFEDFEGDHYWLAVGTSWKDGDNSLQAKTVEKNATSGKKALECTFKFQPNNKGAAFYVDGFENPDWSTATELIADVTNPTDEELTIGFAVCTGSDWNWMELAPQPLKPGLNKDIVMNLTAQTYASGLTSWQFTGALQKMQDVKRFVVKINGPVDLESSVFIDNIRLAE